MKKQNTDKTLKIDPLLMETLKGNPFLVPKDYFSTLQEEILLRKSIPELGESSYKIPENYQDHLRQDILSKVSELKLKEQFPTSTPPIPVDYFNDLQHRILARTVNDKEAQLTEPHFGQDSFLEKPIKRIGIRKWIPYAAAASIMIAMGLFATVDGLKTPQSKQALDYSAQIDDISSDEIIHYLASNTESGDLQHLSEQLDERTGDIADDFSDQELEAYLEYSL